jgi:hypothetical protein
VRRTQKRSSGACDVLGRRGAAGFPARSAIFGIFFRILWDFNGLQAGKFRIAQAGAAEAFMAAG